uniref:Uncharacterized protein n=1 Tax=Romanomermis culicivorax TaxID=13658 RepID=A0A915HQK9_ROMCU
MEQNNDDKLTITKVWGRRFMDEVDGRRRIERCGSYNIGLPGVGGKSLDIVAEVNVDSIESRQNMKSGTCLAEKSNLFSYRDPSYALVLDIVTIINLNLTRARLSGSQVPFFNQLHNNNQ